MINKAIFFQFKSPIEVVLLRAGAISIALVTILFLFASPRAESAINRSVTIVPNDVATPTTSELVTMGVPFPACLVSDTDDFRLLNELGNEVPIFVKTTLNWHSRSACPNAARAIKVQFLYNASNGSKIYTWDLSGRNTANDRPEQAISKILTDRTSLKGSLNEPRVFAVHRPDYLVDSGIVAPTSAITTDDYDVNYFRRKWEYDARDFNYVSSSAANWLFDRVTTNYRQAIRRGDVEHYREAYLSHEFWTAKIETTGTNTSVTDYCVGGFDFGGKADTFGDGGDGCDTKYIYAEPFKLHLALTGDDSWQPSGPAETTRQGLFLRIADTLYQGDERCPTNGSCQNGAVPAAGFSLPYSSAGQSYTERKSGFGLQTMQSVCELTGDATVCGNVDTIINNMHAHLTANPDGIENQGFLRHSWHRHEGSFPPYIGAAAQASNTNSVLVKDVVENLGIAISSGNTIRIRARLSSGTSNDIDASGSPFQNGNNWQIPLQSPVEVTLENGVLAGSEGGSAVNFALQSDRAFSPWMQGIVADGIWQYYHWTEDTVQKNKARDLLLGFARAYTAYAIDGTRLSSSTKTAIEGAFNITVFNSGITAKTGCGLTTAPYTRYVANSIMGSNAMNRSYSRYMFNTGGFSDQHLPEGLFQVALGIYFETDSAKKAAMQAVASDMQNWFARWQCTSGNRSDGPAVNDPPRAYNWQNRSDPFGTYHWVLNGGTPPPQTSRPKPPSNVQVIVAPAKGEQ